MPSKRYSVEQIVAKPREADRLRAQGQTIAQVCKRVVISDQTFLPLAHQVRRAEGGDEARA